MNKTELIDQIATSADLSKAAAGRALEATEFVKRRIPLGQRAGGWLHSVELAADSLPHAAG